MACGADLQGIEVSSVSWQQFLDGELIKVCTLSTWIVDEKTTWPRAATGYNMHACKLQYGHWLRKATVFAAERAQIQFMKRMKLVAEPLHLKEELKSIEEMRVLAMPRS